MKIPISLLLIIHLPTALFAPQITIQAPGTYKIDVSRDYAPSSVNDCVVLIKSSNVTVDFKEQTIGQAFADPGSENPPNPYSLLDGVIINPALTNITIKNARIKNLSGVGIRVNNACTKIRIADSIIENCYTGGILLNGTNPGVIGVEISTSRISSCTGRDGSPAYGIRAIKAVSIKMSDCTVNANDANTTSSGYGISMESSQQSLIKNCTVTSNGGSGIAAGIALTACTKIFIEDCLVQNNTNHDTTYSGSAFGIWINQSSNILSTDCRVSANINTSSYCYGLAVQNGQENVIEYLISGFNQATQQCAGVLFDNEYRSHFLKNELRGNKTTVSGTAYGMLLSGTCEQCFISANKIINNLGITGGFGIKDQRSPSRNVFLENFAFNNQDNYSIVYPPGVSLNITEASLSSLPGLSAITQANKWNNLCILP